MDDEDYGTGSKRRLADAGDNKGKKRFVWPEALHRDFVAAVFDIGLKNANSRQLQEMLPVSHMITMDNIKSHLLKFRLQRDRSRDDYVSHYEMSVTELKSGGHGAGLLPTRRNSSSSAAAAASTNHLTAAQVSSNAQAADLARIAAQQKAFIVENSVRLQNQIDNIANVIAEQTTFLQVLKNSIAKQVTLHGQLATKLAQLNPSYMLSNTGAGGPLDGPPGVPPGVPGGPGGDPQQQMLHQRVLAGPPSDLGSAGAGTTRTELQIMSEMRSHMDMHRQLLMRKEDQLSQYVKGPPHPTRSATMDSSGSGSGSTSHAATSVAGDNGRSDGGALDGAGGASVYHYSEGGESAAHCAGYWAATDAAVGGGAAAYGPMGHASSSSSSSSGASGYAGGHSMHDEQGRHLPAGAHSSSSSSNSSGSGLEAHADDLKVRWPAWKCHRHPCIGSHPGTPTPPPPLTTSRRRRTPQSQTGTGITTFWCKISSLSSSTQSSSDDLLKQPLSRSKAPKHTTRLAVFTFTYPF